MSPFSNVGLQRFTVGAGYFFGCPGTGALTEVTFTTDSGGTYFHLDGSGHIICDTEGIYLCFFEIGFGALATSGQFWGIEVYRDDVNAPIKFALQREAFSGVNTSGNYAMHEQGQLADYFFVGDQMHCKLAQDFGSSQNFLVNISLRKLI